MQTRKKGYHSLSRRIVLQFCSFALIISVVYSLISLVLMYTLEDSFIEQGIQQEATYLVDEFERSGEWPDTRNSNMSLHFSTSTFPEEIRDRAVNEPRRREFYGQQGRHYHLHYIDAYPGVMLVAEVSSELLVRPIRGGIIQFLVISALIVTTIACLIAWLVSRRTTRPLKQLAQLVDGVAIAQLPDKFAHEFPKNEVGILAQVLEQTLTKVSRALEREKSFTRDVSHELRTPLAVVKNAVELCRNSQSAQSSDFEVLERIYAAADQMEKIVQTLLMLAREEHALNSKADTHLMPLIEKAILDNRTLLENKTVDIDIHDNCQVSILVDPNMLKVVLDNLLSNAFKFTESGLITITFEDNALVIRDTGPGIDPEISQHVTELGVKGAQSTGFGFGLSIVKRLCEHQGWVMRVQSHQGTTVTVCFANSNAHC